VVKYFYGAAQFAHCFLQVGAACLSPNQNRLTPTLRSASFFLKRASLAVCLVSAIVFSSSFRFSEAPKLSSFELIVPTLRYGLEIERFADVDYLTQGDDTDLEQVLRDAGLDRVFVDRLVGLSHNKAIVGDLTARETAIFRNGENEVARVAQVISDHEYILIDTEAGKVSVHNRDGIANEYQMATLFYNGDVDSMLTYASFDDELSERVRRGLAQQLKLDESFDVGLLRIIYSLKRDEQGNIIGYGDLEALRYRLAGEDKTVIRFDENELDVNGFFTPDGSPAQRTWLTTPVEGARLSSPFNLRRRHPVLKRVKPHYGTDYAAPYGTPILAVSDGTIIARSRTRGNGKFIKIKHDETYQTQYLHMKAFAKGIKPGVEVKKGQVIGYVGSTGLSSGPHVCFRFWKNGQQVDHRAENLATTSDLTDEAMTAFTSKQAQVAALFDPQA